MLPSADKFIGAGRIDLAESSYGIGSAFRRHDYETPSIYHAAESKPYMRRSVVEPFRPNYEQEEEFEYSKIRGGN